MQLGIYVLSKQTHMFCLLINSVIILFVLQPVSFQLAKCHVEWISINTQFAQRKFFPRLHPFFAKCFHCVLQLQFSYLLCIRLAIRTFTVAIFSIERVRIICDSRLLASQSHQLTLGGLRSLRQNLLTTGILWPCNRSIYLLHLAIAKQ